MAAKFDEKFIFLRGIGERKDVQNLKLSFFIYFGTFRLISVFETTAMLKNANLQYFPLAPFARSIGSLMKL